MPPPSAPATLVVLLALAVLPDTALRSMVSEPPSPFQIPPPVAAPVGPWFAVLPATKTRVRVSVAAGAEAAQTLRTIRPAASTVRVSLRLMWVQAGVATAPSACGASDRLPLGDRRAGVVERGPVEVGDRRLACETECGVDVSLHDLEDVSHAGFATSRDCPRPRASDEDRPRAHRDHLDHVQPGTHAPVG